MKHIFTGFFKKIISALLALLSLIFPYKDAPNTQEPSPPENSLPAYSVVDADYRLNADLTREEHAISDLLFGAFFEDINFAADGGLYAEMVANRSFEFTSLAANDGLFAYTPVNGASLNLTADTSLSLNTNNPTFVTVTNESETLAGIANRGFMEGMAVKAEAYRFSVYARSADYGDSLTVRLCAGEEVLAQAEIPSVGTSWQKYTVTLNSEAEAAENVTLQVLLGKGSIDLDMISLFPVNTYCNRENGMRKDLAETLAAMQPKFLRFPGGCVVEGETYETAYHWKDSVGADEAGEPLLFNGVYGDVASRRQGIDLWTDLSATDDPYPSFMSYGLGFYEFFQLCEDIGAAPVPVLTAGLYCQMRGKGAIDTDSEEFRRDVQDMLDLIEFANGDVTTKWGAVRASMGHPAPFGLTMIAVGNESMWQDYFDRYSLFLDALRTAQQEQPALYGGVELIFSAGPSDALNGGSYLPSYQYAKDWLNGRTDASAFAAATDQHYYQSPEWFLQNADYYDPGNYSRSVAAMTDTVYGGAIPVFLGEYAARSNTVRAALAEAAYMTGLERNGDIVKMASYAPLFSSLTARHWSPNLIWFNNQRVQTTVNYEVQKLFAANTGTALLHSELEGAQVEQALLTGRPGVGTWYTQADFDDLQVVDNSTGETLLQETFDTPESLQRWENPNNGNFEVSQGVLRHTGAEMNYAEIGDVLYFDADIGSADYTFTVTAKKTAGEEGFLIPFSVRDKDNCYFWNLGGWGNTVSCLQHIENGVKTGAILKTSSDFSVETGRTYRLRIEVKDTVVKCYADDVLLIDYDTGHPAEANAYQVVSKDAAGNYILKLVNVTDREKTFAVKLNGADRLPAAVSATTLIGEALDAETCVLNEESFLLTQNAFNITTPGCSVTVLKILA